MIDISAGLIWIAGSILRYNQFILHIPFDQLLEYEAQLQLAKFSYFKRKAREYRMPNLILS